MPYSIELRVMPQQAKIYLISFSTCLPAWIRHIVDAQSCPTLRSPTDCSLPVSSRVCFCALLQGIFWTQGLNLFLPCLLHWQVDSLLLNDWGNPLNVILRWWVEFCLMWWDLSRKVEIFFFSFQAMIHSIWDFTSSTRD